MLGEANSQAECDLGPLRTCEAWHKSNQQRCTSFYRLLDENADGQAALPTCVASCPFSGCPSTPAQPMSFLRHCSTDKARFSRQAWQLSLLGVYIMSASSMEQQSLLAPLQRLNLSAFRCSLAAVS